MRKVVQLIGVAMLAAGFSVAVVGCTQSPSNKDKMKGEKMDTDKMKGDKMETDKMKGDKMKGDKMEKK